MKKTIIIKVVYQIIIGTALSFLYMQFRPYEAYTLAWPFAFLGAWFLLVGWFNYLRYDKLSIFKIQDEKKKQQEKRDLTTKFKIKSFFDYVNSPLQQDVTFTDQEKSKIKMISNFITAALFSILAWIL